MIDFALEAERTGGKTPEESITQACLRRFLPHHDDNHGGHAWRPTARTGRRHRLWNCAAHWVLPSLVVSCSARFSPSTPRRWFTFTSTGSRAGAGLDALVIVDHPRLRWPNLRCPALHLKFPAIVKTTPLHFSFPFFILAALLASCSVGPDYKRPAAPDAAAFKSAASSDAGEPDIRRQLVDAF